VSPAADKSWSKSLRLLRRILMTTIADNGKDIAPFADGLTVRACDLEIVRAEFGKQYFAEGTAEQKAAARRQAFRRAIAMAQTSGLIAIRDVTGAQFVWLVKPESGHP
jgi:hypothetical protein